MAITRANQHLAEIIEILDAHRAKYRTDQEAIDRLPDADKAWIDEEILTCMNDRRYFLSNYYAYRDEKEGFRSLYPFFDSQEILFEEYEKLRRKYGCVRALVLKARQMGSTTYNCAEFFAETIWTPHINGLIVAQDEDVSSYVMGMYESALDFLPYWMRPRKKAHTTGSEINFDEPDDRIRMLKPGLKTWIYADNARKPTGVGRSKTINRALLTELAFWNDGKQLSKSLLPTFNTPDAFYVLESTANGRNDHWHNLWRRAEQGKVNWHPIFIPFYRRAVTYSLPIENKDEFKLTPDELEMRARVQKNERYTITDETFNWVRNRKEEFIAVDGDDTMFYQEYTSTAEESFQSSAVTAFPRQIINRFAKRTVEPKWVGEITWDAKGGKPKLHMRPTIDGEICPLPETFERFHIWEMPEKGYDYGMGVDVALGNPGGDYSVVQVVKKGKGMEPDRQVARWHGLINPTALARVTLAIGWLYNEALAAVEVNSYGMQTNSVLMRNYDYQNIYRYKHLDRITHAWTNIVGFYSQAKSTDALMAKMSEYFMDESVEIFDKHTMDQFRDYTEQGAIGDGAHDDLVDSLMIALYCLREGEVREDEERPKEAPGDAVVWELVDRWGTIIGESTQHHTIERLQRQRPGSSIQKKLGTGPSASVVIAGKKYRVPSTDQNTEFSPIHDKEGTAKRLYEDGMDAEDITPEEIMAANAMEDDEEAEENAEAWKYV